MTIAEAIDKIYEEYGYTVSRLIDFEFDALSGMKKTEKIIECFRYQESKAAGGSIAGSRHYRNYGLYAWSRGISKG